MKITHPLIFFSCMLCVSLRCAFWAIEFIVQSILCQDLWVDAEAGNPHYCPKILRITLCGWRYVVRPQKSLPISKDVTSRRESSVTSRSVNDSKQSCTMKWISAWNGCNRLTALGQIVIRVMNTSDTVVLYLLCGLSDVWFPDSQEKSWTSYKEKLVCFWQLNYC